MSVSQQARRRGQILDEIMRYHREQLPRTMRQVPLAQLRALAQVAPPALDFRAALAGPGVALIAECKKASPSRGLLRRSYNPVALAKLYRQGGARAVSVLTDARHFQGSLADLRDVKEAWPRLPLLRKDFVFDRYQIFEARAAGADAILLIAAVLAPAQLGELQHLARDLGMTALVEVHSAAELERVLPLDPTLIGINNRDLQTFEVDFAITARLRAEIPAGTLVVAESGIKSPVDVREMARIGVDAILVGEALVTARDTLATTRALVRAGRSS